MTQSPSGLSSNRVFALSGLGRERNPGHRILGECRDQLVESLCNWLRDIAAPISEELFVLADSTRERLQQTRYLDLRADIEKDWPQFVEAFRRELSAAAEHCQNQDNPKAAGQATSLEIPDFEGLQLVDDEDLSEHIVIREFAAQISETCDEELYTLNRRVAALLGHDEQIDSANPLAPRIVCNALSDACATIGSDAQSRLLLLRRLERHLHAGLPRVYQQINAYLVERGILPDLKRTYRRGAAAIEASTSAATSAPGLQVAAGVASAAGTVNNNGILDALHRIARMRGGVAPMSAGALQAAQGDYPTGQAAGPAIDPAVVSQLLLSSLNEMQHAPAVEPDNVIINQVRMVRESDGAKQVGGLEAVTIDIVAMLFDFIFDDSHVPVAIKALLSRLQIPVLKVAMLNPGFFADRQHPTRRFLGGVSGVAIRWGNAVDEADPFYRKLSDLVDRIQSEFENDVEIFGTALTELEDFVREHESEEDHTTLTAANVVIQRELEVEALERAQRAVRTFRTQNTLPPLIDAFLDEHWVDVLRTVAIKNSGNEVEWKAASDVMTDLVWSIEPKKNPADRLKLISLLPKLLAQLNKGLDSIGAQAEQRAVFFDGLMKFHSAALKGDTPVAAPQGKVPDLTPSFTPQGDGDLLVTRSVDHGIEVEEVVLVGAPPVWRADEREIYRQVHELKRGDWVEFCDAEGNKNRERLNWISPQRGILLFSNHRSAKAISIVPEALVRQIRDGNATILLEEAIFERALSGALESISAA